MSLFYATSDHMEAAVTSSVYLMLVFIKMGKGLGEIDGGLVVAIIWGERKRNRLTCQIVLFQRDKRDRKMGEAREKCKCWRKEPLM